jgi:hypothetical protein
MDYPKCPKQVTMVPEELKLNRNKAHQNPSNFLDPSQPSGTSSKPNTNAEETQKNIEARRTSFKYARVLPDVAELPSYLKEFVFQLP